ncbi:DotU family type IV/VI secretion system protein [Vibrio profundum]|uniref:DotU family type IV/VI secretion system protein n=1 Tax=Vibrio profundum TaxID=2910247 RepID=UPI003D0F7F15
MTLIECFQPLMVAVRRLISVEPVSREHNEKEMESELERNRSNYDSISSKANPPSVQWPRSLEALREEAEQMALKLDVPFEAIEEARFIIYVWVDEAVLSSQLEGNTYWQPWQWTYFKTHIGGEEFFARLHQRVSAPATAQQRQLLSIYALCLGMGFCGKYAQFHHNELQKTRAALSRQLLTKSHLSLKDSALNEPSSLQVLIRKKPLWRLVDPFRLALLSIALVSTFGVYFVYQTLLNIQLSGWVN